MSVFHATFPSVGFVGIAIARTQSGHHVGFVYRNSEQLRLVHLAWHHILKDEAFNGHDCYLSASAEFEAAEAIALAGILANVERSVGEVPYGIDWETADDCFSAKGELIPLPVGKGLTCTTFLDAVLRSNGYKVVDRDTWEPQAGDKEWGEGIIESLRSHEVDDAHVSAVRNDIGKIRLRPEQFAGAFAGAQERWPVSHPDARQLGEIVLGTISEYLNDGSLAIL